MVKKKTSVIVSFVCLMLLCFSFAFVGVLASKQNDASINFSFSYQQGVYARAYLACSDANSEFTRTTGSETSETITGFRYYGQGLNNSFEIKQGNTVIDNIDESKFFDSYTNYAGSESGNAVTGTLNITNANCSDFGVFKIYIFIENFSNYPIWADVKITSTDNTGETDKDINLVKNSKFYYESGNLEKIEKFGLNTDYHRYDQSNLYPGTYLKIITLTAKTSQGLGDGIALNVQTNLGIAYDYIKSDGSAYFNLNQSFTEKTRVEADIETLTGITGEALLGYSGTSPNNFYISVNNSANNHQFGTKQISPESQWVVNTSYNIRMGVYSNLDFWMNQAGTNAGTYSGTFTTGNAYLFKINGSDLNNFSGKFYNLKIYTGEELIHDYIPATDFNGKICLYDKVEKTFLSQAVDGDSKPIGSFTADFD